MSRMQKSKIQKNYFTFTLKKDLENLNSVDKIIEYFRSKIDSDPIASFIAVFDHYAHTSNLSNGEIADDILAAKIIIFCFGSGLMSPVKVAQRPCTISILEKKDCFIVSFPEPVGPPAAEKMLLWANLD